MNLEHVRIEKEKESLRGELQRMRKSLTESRTQLSGMEKEISNLQHVRISWRVLQLRDFWSQTSRVF